MPTMTIERETRKTASGPSPEASTADLLHAATGVLQSIAANNEGARRLLKLWRAARRDADLCAELGQLWNAKAYRLEAQVIRNVVRTMQRARRRNRGYERVEP